MAVALKRSTPPSNETPSGSGTALIPALKLAEPAVMPLSVATRVSEYGLTVLPAPDVVPEKGLAPLGKMIDEPIWWEVSNRVLLFPPYAANADVPPRAVVPPTWNAN